MGKVNKTLVELESHENDQKIGHVGGNRKNALASKCHSIFSPFRSRCESYTLHLFDSRVLRGFFFSFAFRHVHNSEQMSDIERLTQRSDR